MKERDIHFLQLDCQNRLKEEHYEYPDQNKLEEVLEILENELAVSWVDYEVGELLNVIKETASCKVFSEFYSPIAEGYYNKLFSPEKSIGTHSGCLVLNRPCDSHAFNKYENEYNKIIIISPKFDISTISRKDWGIEQKMYSLVLTRKKNEDSDSTEITG